MNKEQIIEKIVNDLPISDMLGKMTKEEWYGWFEEFWDKAINYTGCCKTLKGKEVITFEEWKEQNCKHLEGDLYSFENGGVFDSYGLRYIYIREVKQ